jgi:hypothetical protein
MRLEGRICVDRDGLSLTRQHASIYNVAVKFVNGGNHAYERLPARPNQAVSIQRTGWAFAQK